MDPDIIKLLQSIEKLIKGAMKSTDGGGTFSSKLAGVKQARDDSKNAKVFKAMTTNLKDTDEAIEGLYKNLVVLNKEVKMTSSGFADLRKQMARFGMSLGGGRPAAPGAAVPSFRNNVGGGGRGGGRFTPATGGGTGGQGPRAILGNMLNNVANSTIGFASLGNVVSSLFNITKRLTGEFFSLSSIGMGSLTTLKDLSVNALLAGMSLKEYTQLVTENTAFASRAGSIQNFAKVTAAQDDMLASMGIFGNEARTLQASLANSNTLMGVSQGKLTDAAGDQLRVFEKLRHSTNMTATEFGNLVKSVAENDQTQRELVGLDPRVKMARVNELLAINTTGQRLGLTAKASAELADALIKQRKDTVKSRFEQAGKIQQLGAFVGQGAQGERAGQLLRKGRKSAAETEELRNLLGGLDAAAQGLYDIGDFSVQNVIDQLGPDAGDLGSAGDIMKATRAATNAAESGAVGNKDFGQHVGVFGQAVGKFSTLLQGFLASIGPMALGGLGTALAVAFRGPIIAGLTAALGLGGGVAGAAAGGLGALGTAIGSLARVFAPAATLISGIMEAFTGEMANAFDPGGGWLARAQGILVAMLGAIPQVIIDALGFVFGKDFMKPIQSVFDTMKVVVVGAINSLLLGITTAVSWLTDFLPKDSGLRKLVDGARESLKSSLDANFKTYDQLGGIFGSEGRRTLSEISTENTKTAETAKKAATATTKAAEEQAKFNNVQMGGAITKEQLIGDARTILGSPQVQARAAITPGTVNTADTPAVAAAEEKAASVVSSNADMVAILQSILGVLTQSLTFEEKQAMFAEQLARRGRSAGFEPAEMIAHRLHKQGMA
jgi:hypothetical protein